MTLLADMTPKRIKLISFVIGTLLLLVGIPIAERTLLLPEAGEKLCGQLSKVQEETIKSAKDIATLLINWAFVLIGFNAWFIRRSIEGTRRLQTTQKLSCAVGVVAAVVSIFFGQAALSGVALLLQSDIFSITNRAIRVPSTYQFVALLLSVASAAVLVIDEVFWPDSPPSSLIS